MTSTSSTTEASPRRSLRRIIPAILIISLLYCLVFIYPSLRLAQWGELPLLGAYYTLISLPLILFASRFVLPKFLYSPLGRFVYTWMGAAFILLCLVVVAEVATLLWPYSSKDMGRVVLLLWLGISSYGFINAQRLQIKIVNLVSNKLQKPQRLVQISDVHIGSRHPALLNRIVKKIQQLQPDYVVITGDLIDEANISELQLKALANISAPVYYIIGNHERYVDLSKIDQRLRNLGIRVLRNQVQQDGEFTFIGIDDAESRSQVKKHLAKMDLPDDGYRVLLYHRPDGFEDAQQHNIDLMLCGHTHNGQIVPFNFIVKRVFKYIKGLYQQGSSYLYVSTGTGTWGPILRLGSANEITLFELTPNS